jgi:hypothetical protein
MPFPKRDALMTWADPDSAATPHLPELATASASDRHAALRDTMLRILADTVAIADAMRTGGTVAMKGFAGIMDAEAAPIPIRGFAEHFTAIADGELLHAMFTSVSPERLDQLNPTPQFLLHDLVCRVRDLNLFCQEAEREEALGVALQSPGLAVKVDRILILSAFLAGYFENLTATGPIPVGLPGKVPATIDFPALEAALKRHVLMGSDRMLEPERLADHMPNLGWPHLGAEVLRRPESGQEILHGVYFPALYARQLAAKVRAAAHGQDEPCAIA